MAQLRVKIELNKGRHGIPIHKLAEIAKEAEKFFSMFADDIHLGKGEWIADNFVDGSVGFDNNFVGEAPDAQIILGQKALKHLTDPKTKPDSLSLGIRKETFLQYAKIAFPVDADDGVLIGVYNGNGNQAPEMRELTKQRALEIEKEISQPIEMYGGIQGVIHSFYKEAKPPYVHIREFSTNELVKCFFKPSSYDAVWRLMEKKDAVVNVEGWIKTLNGKVEHLKIELISEAAQYQTGDLDKFFGCAPNLTGNMSTDEFISDLRGEDE